MLTRSRAAQSMRFRRSPSEEGRGASYDLPCLPGAEMLDWDHVDPADARYQAVPVNSSNFRTSHLQILATGEPDPIQPLDSLGFHLDTAGKPYSFLELRLHSVLRQRSRAG